jgi:phosphopantothenoylcysteine decarboxylase/phosphopantothenate--cysteine ligase
MGCRVKVVMTENATKFAGPTTFGPDRGAGGGLAVGVAGGRVHHISLAQEADVFAIAPATANVIAKMRAGRRRLAHTSAWRPRRHSYRACDERAHVAGRGRVSVATQRGAIVVSRAARLACGDVGGRLADTDTIAEAVLAEATRSRDLLGVRCSLTAGPTREPLDPVQVLGKRIERRTGYAIAERRRAGRRCRARQRPDLLPDPFGVRTVRVTTALEMASAVDAAYGDRRHRRDRSGLGLSAPGYGGRKRSRSRKLR